MGILVIVGLLAVYIAYTTWLQRGVKPRVFVTVVPADQVRAAFVDKVARTGWQIVDDGPTLVAQSSLLTGHRQQIGLHAVERVGGTHVDIRPLRMRVRSLSRVPTKGHTLRLRMNSFVAAVKQADPGMQTAA